MDATMSQKPQWEDLVIRPGDSAPAVSAAPAIPVSKPQTQQALPASYLTHELRAPITSIRLGLEILQEQVAGRLQADEKQMLALAVKNTSRLEGLVNDIMDFSKIMAGKMRPVKEPCDPRGLLSEAFDSMRAMALGQGVKLVKDDGEPLPRVAAEGRRVIQVLTNLISNAVKFTPQRGTVTISCSKGQYEHAGTIVFKVKDTGRGIPAKDIEKIFDMFVQSSNTKSCEGTGLGLTLSRLMVEMHGGRIWAESWKEIGSTFFFTIPISVEDMVEKVDVYPKPLEVTGLLVSFSRRFNAFLALFV